MEERELKNENNTITLDSLEISKREDEDIAVTAQNNGDKDIQGVKTISLGKSLLGDNTLKKGISVSVRGRNVGGGLNLKNGGSVWKKKDEKGSENQREEIGKKIDEESFPDLLESTEKIKSELSKEKDKKKKGGKDMKKPDDGTFRHGSEKGKGENVSGDKRKPFPNNLETSQNNDGALKNSSDQVNENEATDIKENEHIVDGKQEAEGTGYLMPGFKGKHMIGFYCFLKKGSQNPPPLPPNVPFDDTSFFEIIEKQKSLIAKPVIQGLTASQQMAQLGQGNQMMHVMQTNPLMNMQHANFVNSGNNVGSDINQNQMNRVNKVNSFNTNDKMIREQQEGVQNRFMQNSQVSGLSRNNLNMFNENLNNVNSNNNINNVNKMHYQNRNVRNFGQNNVNYNVNNTNGLMKNNMQNNMYNYNKGSTSMGSMSAGGSMRQRNFNRRNDKRDDKKVKIADIDADTNWRSHLNKKVDDEKTVDVSNETWNGNMDNNNNNNNNNTGSNNMYNNDNTILNNNNINTGTDRIKRNIRNRNTNTLSNMGSMGSGNNFNRTNFNTNQNFVNRNNNANNNNINRNNINRNNNMNNNFMNNNMNMNLVRNNMSRGNGNINSVTSVANNNNYNNYNNIGNNKSMNRNYVKRNVNNMQNFGNNESGNNEGVLTNNLFNRISGNNFQSTNLTPPSSTQTPPSDRWTTNIEQENNVNMPNDTAVAPDRVEELNAEVGNN